jgi:hypothetical protein
LGNPFNSVKRNANNYKVWPVAMLPIEHLGDVDYCKEIRENKFPKKRNTFVTMVVLPIGQVEIIEARLLSRGGVRILTFGDAEFTSVFRGLTKPIGNIT